MRMRYLNLRPHQAPVVVAVFIVTMLSGMVYLVGQQNLRSGANEPQVALVQDAVTQLQNGSSPENVIANLQDTDLAQTLSPFMIIYSASGVVVASSTTLNGKVPVPPSGVFDYAKSHIDDRITWQPVNGVREATVVRYIGGSDPAYVLAGRSLIEVEKRENQLGYIILIGWFFTVIGSLLIFWILDDRSLVKM